MTEQEARQILMRQRDAALADVALLTAQNAALVRNVKALVELIKHTGEMRDPHLYLCGQVVDDAEFVIKLAEAK